MFAGSIFLCLSCGSSSSPFWRTCAPCPSKVPWRKHYLERQLLQVAVAAHFQVLPRHLLEDTVRTPVPCVARSVCAVHPNIIDIIAALLI